MGDSRERAETLDANHLQMCRMSGNEDPNYRKVASEIRTLYRAVSNGENSTKEPGEEPRSTSNDKGTGKLSVLELGAE